MIDANNSKKESLLSKTTLPLSDKQRGTSRSSSSTMKDGLTHHSHQTQGRVRSMNQLVTSLPSTMKQNSDGTFSIYTGKQGDELFTEIPFLAVHGLQTSGRDECGVIQSYMDNFHEIWEGPDTIDLNPTMVSGKVTNPLIIATMAVALLQFLVGYNVAVLNNPERYIFPGHGTLPWSMAVAALAIGAPLGASIGGKFIAQQGRRRGLIFNILIYLLAGVTQTSAPNLAVMTVGRLIVGVGCGFATVIVPIFLGELAPPNIRGSIGTVNQFAYVIGILASDLLSFRFANEDGWRKLVVVNIFIGLFQLILVPFVEESPRWRIEQNPKDSEAKHILQKLRGYNDQDELDREFASYTQASQAHGQEEEESIWDLIQSMCSRSGDRYLFICVLLFHVSKQVCGVNVVFYYSTQLFENVIDNPLLLATIIASVNVVFTYVALILMDSCGRKSLLLWSYGGMFCSCVTLILSQNGVFQSMVGVVAVNAYVAFFGIGVGPIVWLIIVEMFEAKYVTVVMILCSQLGWMVNFGVSLVFPSLLKALGDMTYVPFSISLVIGFLFTWFALPETHGRSPAQVLVDVKYKAAYADKVSNIKELARSCSGGDWQDKVVV